MRIAALHELLIMREKWQRDGRQVVFTNGVFDLLHSGHVAYLQQASALGDVLVVGVNSDASTRRIKGEKRPIVPEDERAAMLIALRCVDYVTIFDQPTACDLVAALKPDMYVKGGDYRLPPQEDPSTEADEAGESIDYERLPEAKVVRSSGGNVVLLSYHEGYSSTTLIERIVNLYQQ